jgi:hypothetical protein
MLQQVASYPLKPVRDIFDKHGIHPIQEFEDGVIVWGDEPFKAPYTGKFQIAGETVKGRYDIFTIRAILSKLDKVGDQDAVEAYLLDHMHDDLEEDDDDDQAKTD